MGNCTTSKGKNINNSRAQLSIKILDKRRKISKSTGMSYIQVSENYKYPKMDVGTSIVNIHKIYNLNGKVIGKGHFGSVVLAQQIKAPHAVFVAKIIEKAELREDIDYVISELNLMRDTDHPNIIKFCETYSSKERLYIIMEYLEGGTLKEYQKTKGVINEIEAREIVFQMCLAINHLHEKTVAHRDIKLDNFLFKRRGSLEIKLIDFGLAKNYSKSLMSSHIGTPYYASPEILLNQVYDERCDEWSLGIAIYKMLTGHYPFSGNDAHELFANITLENYDARLLKPLSTNAQKFIKSLLIKNPAKRKKVRELLHHPWLNSYHLDLCRMNFRIVDDGIFDNIVSIIKINAFGIQLLKVLLIFFSPPSDYNKATKAFFCADYSLTGFVTSKGLVKFFYEHGKNLVQSTLDEIMKSLCLFEEGFITSSEFVIAAINRYDWIVSQKLVPRLFNFLDVDNSSHVTIDNLKELFKRFGFLIDKSYIEKLITFMGADAVHNGFDLNTFEKFVYANFFQ